MSSFVQSRFTKNNVLIEVIGSENGYCYRWIKLLNENAEIIDYNQYLSVSIIDYSWSMLNSNSDNPTTKAIKLICERLLVTFPEILV